MLLSIIVVSYNTQDLTLQTLQSVLNNLQNSQLLKTKTEIILVDNHSQDQTVNSAKKLFSQRRFRRFTVIVNRKNLGFAKANNQAIKQAKGQYILLLNSDTIVQNQALDILVKTMQSAPDDQASAQIDSSDRVLDQLGLLSPILLNTDGSIQAQGGSRLSLLAIFNQMLFLDDLPLIGRFLPSTQHTGLNARSFVTSRDQSSQLIRKDWIAGTAMLIKREVIDTIGLLDGNIFMYGEDQEFCLRAKNHHFDIAIHPQAQVVHLGSASSSSSNAICGELKSYLYIWRKHFPHWQLPILKLILKIGVLLRIMVYSLTFNQQARQTYRQAWLVIK